MAAKVGKYEGNGAMR